MRDRPQTIPGLSGLSRGTDLATGLPRRRMTCAPTGVCALSIVYGVWLPAPPGDWVADSARELDAAVDQYKQAQAVRLDLLDTAIGAHRRLHLRQFHQRSLSRLDPGGASSWAVQDVRADHSE